MRASAGCARPGIASAEADPTGTLFADHGSTERDRAMGRTVRSTDPTRVFRKPCIARGLSAGAHLRAALAGEGFELVGADGGGLAELDGAAAAGAGELGAALWGGLGGGSEGSFG